MANDKSQMVKENPMAQLEKAVDPGVVRTGEM